MERTSSRLHVAVLDEELPYPLNSGKRIRTFNLLSRLSKRHRLTLLCHRSTDSVEAETAMRELGIRTIVVDRQIPAKSGFGFYKRLAANLFSSLPYSVETHHSGELQNAIAELSRKDPPDLWHCEWTPYAEYLRKPPSRAPWVVMAHNVESLIWQRYVETENHPLKRWYINRQFRKFERFERWAYSACDMPIAVSADDARLIQTRFGVSRVEVVDNGVDPAYFEPDPRIERDPCRILFLGSLDWRPNIDAVHGLVNEIFPMVQQLEPRATLQIVGRKPSEALYRSTSSRPGIELHADVADVRPFLARAGMLAVPLRIGGGSRLKILEALAAGLPVVSTRIGAEGLHVVPGEHVTVADTPAQLAQAMLAMMRDPDHARQQAARGRERVLERYDWKELADRLESVWQRTTTARPSPKPTCPFPVSDRVLGKI